MNIRFGSSFLLQEKFLTPLKEKISFTLTNRQKVVMALAFLALVLIAASCRLLGRCRDFTASNIPDGDDDESSSELKRELEKKNYPDDVFIEVFKRLDVPSWGQLAAVNHHLNEVSKRPEVLSHVLTTYQIPADQRLELAKQFKGHLKEMDLDEVLLTGPELEELFAACPNIVDLDLSLVDYEDCKSNLTAADLVHLSKLKLKSLKLRHGGDKLTDADLIKLTQSQPSLESLSLQNCPNVTDQGLVSLPPNLKALHAKNCVNITSQGVKRFQALEALTLETVPFINYINIAELPRNLQSLNLFWFSIDSTNLKQLPQELTSLSLVDISLNNQAGEQLPPNLKFLKLRNLNGMNFRRNLLPLDMGIVALLQKLPFLESLDLSENDLFFVKQLLSTPEFKALNINNLKLNNLMNWQSLDLYKTTLVCLPLQLESLSLQGLYLLDEWIIAPLQKLQSLKFLNLEGCSELTNAVVRYLPKTLECLICPDGTKLTNISEAKEHFLSKSNSWFF